MAYGNATAIMTTMTALSVARTGDKTKSTPPGQEQVCVVKRHRSQVVQPCTPRNASDPHSPARHPQTRHTHHTRPHSQASQGRAARQGSHPKSAPHPNVTAEPTPPQTKAAKPSPIDTSDLGPAMRVVGQDAYGNDITVPDTPTLSRKDRRVAKHEAAKAQDYLTLTETAQCLASVAAGTTLAGPIGGIIGATLCLPTAGAAKAEEPRSCERSQLEYRATTYNSDRPNFATIFAKTPIKTGNCYALVLNQLYRENIITKPDVQTFFTNLRARGSTGQAYNELLFPFLQQFGTTTHFREPESLKQSWDAGKIPSGSLIGFLKHTDGSIFHIGRTCHDQYSKPQMQHLLRERLQNLNGVFFSDPQPLIDSAKGKDGQFFVIQLHHPARPRLPEL